MDVPDFESEVFKEGFSLKDFFEGSMGQEFQETEGILSASELPMPRSELIEEQRLDAELKGLFDDLVDISVLLEYPNCFYLKSGVLMPQYRPLHTPSTYTWHTIHQIVLPHSLRDHVLAIAHDNIYGHLGVTKTYRKIFEHFYWPKMRRDVTIAEHVISVRLKVNQALAFHPIHLFQFQ